MAGSGIIGGVSPTESVRQFEEVAMTAPRENAMPFSCVDDHSMDQYVEKIRAAINKATGR
jgi:hypothetical protein